MKTGRRPPFSMDAAANAGLSASRKSSRNQTREGELIAPNHNPNNKKPFANSQ
jgi:hypothetical protein